MAIPTGDPEVNDDSASLLGSITDWAVSVMETLGGPGAALIIALENLFPPLPSEVILPLAGFTASRGDMTVAGAIAWTTLGSVVGALVLYGIGVWIGRDRVIAFADWFPLLKVSDFEKTEAWFVRHGSAAVFFGRMVPIFRSLVSLPAGVEHMPLPRFVAYTVAGSLIWNTLFVVAGYQLGENWETVERYASTYSRAVLFGALAFIAGWVVWRIMSNRRRRDSSEA